MKNILLILTFLFCQIIFADCVNNAKDSESYKILETGYGAKIYFSGTYESFIITLDGSLYSSYISEIYFIKDSFCSYDSDVIVIDDEVFGVSSVSVL
jgi:hypothetical protein